MDGDPANGERQWLQQAGLALPILDPESAILIGLQRV
jgi:alpha-galactosidase